MKNMRTLFKNTYPLLLVLAVVLGGCTSKSPAPVERGGMSTRTLAADTYVVKAGDTLYSIARELGIDHRELIVLNHIETPDSILVGQILKIKASNAVSADSVSATTTAPISSGVVVVKPIGVEPSSSIGSGNTDTYKREPKAGKEVYSDDALARAQNPNAASTPSTSPSPSKPDEARPETKVAEATPPVTAAAESSQWLWPSSGALISSYNEKGNKGLDFSGKAGDPIFAAANGKVVYSGSSLRGYGKLLIINHNDSYTSVYAHNRALLVNENQTVKQGQKIAEMGNTETDRVKLHFEIRKLGNPVDPLKFLPKR